MPTAACACHSSRESALPVGRSTAGIFEFFLSPLRYRLEATPRSLASLGVATTVGSYAVHPCHDGIKTLVSFPTRGGGKNRSGRGYAAMLMVEQATGCLTAARTASGSAHPLRGYPPFQPRVAVGGELPPPPARLVVVTFGRSPAPRVPAPGSERTAPLLPPLSSQRQSAA